MTEGLLMLDRTSSKVVPATELAVMKVYILRLLLETEQVGVVTDAVCELIWQDTVARV